MRPLIVIIVWIILIGGLTLYMRGRDEAAPVQTFQVEKAEGTYSLDVTTTFAVEPDPFAVDLGTDDKAPALVVKINGVTVLERTERVPAGAPIRLDDIPGILEGTNEFYVEANPPVGNMGKSYAVRIRIMRDGITVADHTEWSRPGEKIAAAFPLETGEASAADSDTH